MFENMSAAEWNALPLQAKAAKKRKGKTPEAKVLKACRDWLKTHRVPHWRNSVGGYIKGDQYMPYGVPGMADLECIINRGKYRGVHLSIETKAGKNGQSPNQQAWQRMVEAAGGIYILAYSTDELERRKGDIAP